MDRIRSEVDQLGTYAVVRLAGELAVATVAPVRLALVKALVEQPDALLVDVADLRVTEPSALSVFAAVARQATDWPGTPLMICAPTPAVADLLEKGHYGPVGVFPSVAAAIDAVPTRSLSSLRDILLPTDDAPRRARDLTTGVCLRWDLPALIGPAGLVAAELVTNAVVHARTMIVFGIARRRRYLHIAVRDGSTDLPVAVPVPGRPLEPAAPRGLLLVDAVSRRWGSRLSPEGKVVWAMLDLYRPRLP